MTLTEFDGDAWVLRPSPTESARFGLEVARLTIPRGADPAGGALAAAIELSGADLVITRFHTARPGLPPAVPGFVALEPSVLNYWKGDVAEIVAAAARPGIRTSDVSSADAHLVHELTGAIFAGYRNHYADNPRLDAGLAAAGYAEWAVSTVLDPANRSVLLWRDDAAAGLATVRFLNAATWEIELAGVTPGFRRQGLYPHLMEGVRERAARAGTQSIVISTQAENTDVQRVWTRTGYHHEDTITTVHMLRTATPAGAPYG